jgi:hypothetical protein
MAPPRRLITRDMIQAAKDQGWHLSLTANHYGMHRSSIAAACERFGIVLPMHQFSPQRVSPKSKVWVDVIDGETKPKVKLSASPRAIERALEDIDREKRLRASG